MNDPLREVPNLIKNYLPNDELEVRVGNFTDRGFIPGKSEYIFHMITNYLSRSGDYYLKRYIQKIYFYDDGYRLIIDTVTGGRIMMRKINKGNLDVYPMSMRISLNSEVKVDRIPPGKKLEKDRIRTSLINKRGDFKIDISSDTIRKFYRNEVRTFMEYHIELEFIRLLDITSINAIITWFNNLMKEMDENQDIALEYNSMIPGMKFKSVPYTGEKMPKNIKSNLIPFMEDYTLISKPNGVNYILYITSKKKVVLLNKTDCVYINLQKGNGVRGEEMKVTPKIYRVAVFGEFLDGKFYAIDTILFMGKNVINENYDSRWKKLAFIKKYLNWENFNILPIFSEGSLYDRVSNVLKYISEWPKDKNDGIIFKPGGLPFNNDYTYKWKPWDENTIDFAIKRLGRGKNVASSDYQLLCYTSGENPTSSSGSSIKLVPFRGNTSHPISSTVNIPDNLMIEVGKGVIPPDLTIIEFGIKFRSGGHLSFIPKRIRYDKIKPNFISVAESIWDDIFNPMNENVLKRLSSTNFTMGDTLKETVSKACEYVKITGDVGILENIPVCRKGKIIDIFKEETLKAISIGKSGRVIDALKRYFKLG